MEKRNRKVIILSMAFSAILSFSQLDAQVLPIYSIVGSNSIKEGSSFRFSMLSKNLNEPLQANFSLSGTDDKGNFLSLSRLNVIVPVDDAQTFELDTSEFYRGQYSFYANVYDPSNNNMVFDTWPLQFLPQVFHILIQTDKQLYRAEDLIRFRLFAFDADTKPVNIRGSSLVSIINSQGFVVSEFANVTFVNGRFGQEFQLANIVSTGLWIVRVTVDEKIFEKTIEIDQYELPLFTASIDVPVYVAISDGSFPVRINVDYAFGKTMHGEAVVKFIRFGQLAIFQKTLTIGNEIGLFDVNISSNLGITSDETVDIELQFTDAMSDKVINATAATRLRRIATILELKASETFKRNVDYNVVISARGYDGSPVENKDVTVEIFFQAECYREDPESEWTCPEETVTRTYSTDDEGVIETEISTGEFDYITIEATCDSCETANIFAEFHDPIFEIILKTEKPTVDLPVNIEVDTIHEFQSAFCYFLAKNVHLDLKVITFTNGVSRFEFIPTGEYTPVTQITCVGIDTDGQRHATQMDINFEQLPSKTSVEVLTPIIEPGMNASIRVTGALHSTVSLLAMDQRLLNLQKSRSLGDPSVNLRNQLMLFMRDEAQSSVNFEMLRMPNPITTTTDTLATAPTVLPGQSLTRTPLFKRRNIGKSFAFATNNEDNPPRLRRNFQETFLWIDVEIETPSEDDPTQGSEVIYFETPDSITSFAISAFSLSRTKGAGILETPTSIMNFMPFFIEADLPFSMKQSETLFQTVTIFNYMDEDVQAYVTIGRTENDPDFYIINEQMEWMVLTDFYGRIFTSNRGTVRSFIIGVRPLKTGLIPITIGATGPTAGDRIVKHLRVIPAGIERVLTDSILLLKPEETASTTLSCAVPAGIDVSTISTQISFVGDLLGDVIANMASLLIQPAGCGEQNMARFSSAVISYHYFKATHQLTDAIEKTIASYTQQGMQKHMALRRQNGAQSYFGSNQGSTWLTAFTVKIFRLASAFSTVDNSLIDSSLQFILTKQLADGGFTDDQTSQSYRNHGGLNNRVAVTSYIAILFSQILSEQPQLRAARDNAISYSLQNVNNANPYELAITCNALKLANHNSFNAKYNILLSLARETADHLYWDVKADTVLNVETSAYALLFMHQVDPDRAIKIVKYLISMKNQNGGWASTQDTVVAVESLADAASSGLLGLLAGNMSIIAWPDVGQSVDTVIDHTNQIELQTFTLDSNARSVNILARGSTSGKTTISFTCRYFENLALGNPRFRVTHSLVEECNTPMRSFICINYIPEGNDVVSNMVIMKMRMPSGYIYDNDTPMPDVIRKIEAEDENSRIVAYFDSMNDQRVCFTINTIQTAIVTDDSLTLLIEVNDYYNPEKRAENFFEVPANLQRC